MPTYQYACTETTCGHRFEAVQSFSDPTLAFCPVCAGQVRKVFSAVGVVFKGSGFYRTDSRAAEDGKARKDGKAEAGSGSATAEKAGSDNAGADKAGSQASPSSSGSASGAGSAPASSASTSSGRAAAS